MLSKLIKNKEKHNNFKIIWFISTKLPCVTYVGFSQIASLMCNFNVFFLLQINSAMAILRARHLLAILLADWPKESAKISAEIFGCTENSQLVAILDLLQKSVSKDVFQKVCQTTKVYSQTITKEEHEQSFTNYAV